MSNQFIAIEKKYVSSLFDQISSNLLRLRIEELVGKSSFILNNLSLEENLGGLRLDTKYTLVGSILDRHVIYLENKDKNKVINLTVVTESLNSYLRHAYAVLEYQEVTSSITSSK